MLATEKLETKLAEVLQHISHDTPRETILQAVSHVMRNTAGDGISDVLNLISNASDEILNCSFRREERREEFIAGLNVARGSLFEAIVSDDGLRLYSWFYSTLSNVRVMSAAVSEALDRDSQDLDRPGLVARTEKLMAEIDEWEMEDYAKKSLMLSLKMVCEQALAQSASSSDVEVRRRIKSVIASFAIEFANVDKEFETRWETLKRWAQFGFQGASTPLGLTADASKIAGLLPKP